MWIVEGISVFDRNINDVLSVGMYRQTVTMFLQLLKSMTIHFNGETGGNGKRSNMQVRVDLVKNMFRNSWKYRMFSDTNFLMFCGRRVLGYLFDKDLD